MLMVIQTLSIASDVLPSHLGDIHHDQPHSHHAIGDPAPAMEGAPDRQSNGDLSDRADHCHGNHCHGSHLLLAMHVFDLPLLMSEHVFPGYNAHTPSGYVDAILRPPIA